MALLDVDSMRSNLPLTTITIIFVELIGGLQKTILLFEGTCSVSVQAGVRATVDARPRHLATSCPSESGWRRPPLSGAHTPPLLLQKIASLARAR